MPIATALAPSTTLTLDTASTDPLSPTTSPRTSTSAREATMEVELKSYVRYASSDSAAEMMYEMVYDTGPVTSKSTAAGVKVTTWPAAKLVESIVKLAGLAVMRAEPDAAVTTTSTTMSPTGWVPIVKVDVFALPPSMKLRDTLDEVAEGTSSSRITRVNSGCSAAGSASMDVRRAS